MTAIEWTQGSTHNIQQFTLLKQDGSAQDLSGLSASAVTLKMCSKTPGSTKTALAGTLAIDDAENGVISFKFAATDVDETGHYLISATIEYGSVNNSDPVNTFPIDFIIS